MERFRGWKKVLSAVAVGALFFASPQVAVAQSNDPLTAKCADLEVVYARGSGQDVNNSEEVNRLRSSLVTGTTETGFSTNFYELGSANYGPSQYEAAAVAGGWSYLTAFGAKISGGEGFKYGRSVDGGVAEAANYINRRYDRCKDKSKFYLAGYSQGAQVIGETYVEELSPEVRNAVIFNGLFGDPKLYLPEGKPEGFFNKTYPAYARGERSEWRRYVPDPSTYEGSLGAREPYLPAGWTSTTGLWCNDYDYVCGSDSNPLQTTGHGLYGTPFGPIAAATMEAFDRLGKARGMSTKAYRTGLKKVFLQPAAGTTGLDIVFVIDSTGSMQDDIDGAKRFAADFADKIEAVHGRVALVEYRDKGDSFSARILSNLNSDVTEFRTELDGIVADGGGDNPEATLHALMTAFDGLSWRPGATKAAVILTDDTFHNPDRVDGSTIDTVVERSLSIDPVNVYTIVPEYSADDYSELADRTSGQVIFNDGDATKALESVLDTVVSRPVVSLPLNEYYTLSTQDTIFDASESYSVDSEIVRWDWDFDGDGIFEVKDGEPVVRHQYPDSGDFNVNVRAFDANGQVGSHSVPVHVDTTTGLPDLPEPATAASVKDVNGEAELTWTADTVPSGGWLIKVNGIIVGQVPPEARSITITDVPENKDAEFGVAPISDEGNTGMTVVAYLGQSNPAKDKESSNQSSDMEKESSKNDASGSDAGSSGDNESGSKKDIVIPAVVITILASIGLLAQFFNVNRGLLRAMHLPDWLIRQLGM